MGDRTCISNVCTTFKEQLYVKNQDIENTNTFTGENQGSRSPYKISVSRNMIYIRNSSVSISTPQKDVFKFKFTVHLVILCLFQPVCQYAF